MNAWVIWIRGPELVTSCSGTVSTSRIINDHGHTIYYELACGGVYLFDETLKYLSRSLCDRDHPSVVYAIDSVSYDLIFVNLSSSTE